MRNVHHGGDRKKAERSRHPSHLSNHPLLSNLILSTPSPSFVSFSQCNAINGSLQRNPSQLVRTCWAQPVGLNGSKKGATGFWNRAVQPSLAALLVTQRERKLTLFVPLDYKEAYVHSIYFRKHVYNYTFCMQI